MRQQTSNGAKQEGYSVEINGPLFYTHIQSLNRLFSQTQSQFTSTCSTLESSTPFNLYLSPPAAQSPSEEDKRRELWPVDTGVYEGQATIKVTEGDSTGPAEFIPINDTNNGRQAIREMTYSDSLYSWST